jgi:hypothetical protein
MEQFTSLVSSRGILKSCALHNAQPVSSRPQVDTDLWCASDGVPSVYVCTDALAVFALQVLPRIEQQFVLVTGDSDRPVDDALLRDPHVQRILNNGHLRRWYAQNLCVDHPGLFPLPIGLDYHTMGERPGFWGLGTLSPIAQEAQLFGILGGARSFEKRYVTAYCNWQFQLGRGDRKECLEGVEKSACFFEPTPVPRKTTWERQAEMMFVLSPSGGGMDCHRTWEALSLGCVPILRDGPLRRVLEGLPCVFVKDWREVTRNFLLEQAQIFSAGTYDFCSLFRETWMRRIRGESEGKMPFSLSGFAEILRRIRL